MVFFISFEQKQPPRRFFKISVLFFQELPFYNFPGGSICSSNRHVFFPGGSLCSSNRHEFSRRAYRTDVLSSRRVYLFVEQTLLSHRADTNFPKNPYLVLEHVRIFLTEQISIFQEPLFSHRTDIHFPGSPIQIIFQEALSKLFSRRHLCLEQIGIFQEGTPTPLPRRTDISLIGLGGCFRFEMDCYPGSFSFFMILK